MKIFNKTTNFNFLRWIGPMAFISASLIALCFWSFFTKGFVLGLDFTGGTLLEVSYTKPIENLSIIRDTLEKAGFPDASVQRFGTPKDILIRLGLHSESNVSNNSNEIDDAHTSKKAFVALKQAANGEAELRRVEFVGPQVGNELIEDGGLAILYALIGILIYVAIRFEYRFAIGAVVATLHDVIMTIGVFSWFQKGRFIRRIQGAAWPLSSDLARLPWMYFPTNASRSIAGCVSRMIPPGLRVSSEAPGVSSMYFSPMSPLVLMEAKVSPCSTTPC